MLRNGTRRFQRALGLPSYLDNQATTPLDPRVLDAMLPFMLGNYGNPHSRSHIYGWDAEDAVEKARGQVASLIKAQPKEIIFTSGATESNNVAIKGACKFLAGKKKHIITTQTEHKCVLASARQLATEGWDVTYLPVNEDGLINLAELESAIRPDTALISVMFVNNEIGVIQPMEEIGALCKKHKIIFHTDAAQAAGKVEIDVAKLNIGLMSLSGHKIYGPKGIGALYVRTTAPRVRLRPLIDGGGQERGMRSGTLPTQLTVGLGAAAALCEQDFDSDKRHVERLSKRMMDGLMEIPAIEINGSLAHRYKGNVNASFHCVEGESLLMELAKDLAVSSGSACTSASLEPSYVLRAIGVDEAAAHTSLRFGIGRFTTAKEVDDAVIALKSAVERLRDMSPLWELHIEGGSEKVVWS